MILTPGDIWRYIDNEVGVYHYLVLSYESEKIVRIQEIETGIVEPWPIDYNVGLQKGRWEQLA